MKLILEFEVDEKFSVGKFAQIVNFAEKVGADFKKADTIRKERYVEVSIDNNRNSFNICNYTENFRDFPSL